MATLLVLGLMPISAEEKILLRCADVHELGYPTVEGVLYMNRLVKQETGGRIEIIVYPGSVLGSENTVVEMVRAGVLEMGRVSSTIIADVVPEYEVFVFPYIFNDNAHKWRVLNGPVGLGLLDKLRKAGLIGLCFQESGTRSFYNSKRPIYRPEDLKGLKLRVQPSKIMVKLVEFFGAYPVPMNYEEIFPALNAKVIDGAENNIPSYYSSGHYHDAGYYSYVRHSSIPEILVMSKKTWKRLKPADQKIIADAARKSVWFQRRKWNEFETHCLRQLARTPCHINEVNAESFRKQAQLFNQKYGRPYAGLLEEIRKAGSKIEN